jgi:hypothetical protein
MHSRGRSSFIIGLFAILWGIGYAADQSVWSRRKSEKWLDLSYLYAGRGL